MSMKQIETLVFDYGGVIVNIDDVAVVKAMESLGVTAFKRLIHVRKIKRLMHQYINGMVAETVTLKEMLSLCRKGTTSEDIEKVLEELCGNLPVGKTEGIGQTSEAVQGLSAQQHQRHALAEIGQSDEAVGIFHGRAV